VVRQGLAGVPWLASPDLPVNKLQSVKKRRLERFFFTPGEKFTYGEKFTGKTARSRGA
jgi:hypothetical protein